MKNTGLAIDYIRNTTTNQSTTQATTALTNVNGWISKNNTNLNTLISAKTAIENAKSDIQTASRNIKEQNESLNKIMSGADALDIRSQQLSIAQKELEYDKYNIRAPFDGILAKLDVKVGDTTSGSIGVFITKQKVADITLNEVDIANIKIGQPVELTFDAVEGLIATGTVASIDLVGTVTQGVVSYTTQVAFETPDERIKQGMSVSATIITNNKTGVLVVPASAIKTKGSEKYVEVAEIGTRDMGARNQNADVNARGSSTRNFSSSTNFNGMSRPGNNQSGITLPTPPTSRAVTTGDSNDTLVEILSGITEGEFVVTKTVAGTSTTSSAPAANSLFGTPRTGSTGGMGGTRAR